MLAVTIVALAGCLYFGVGWWHTRNINDRLNRVLDAWEQRERDLFMESLESARSVLRVIEGGGS